MTGVLSSKLFESVGGAPSKLIILRHKQNEKVMLVLSGVINRK